MENPTDKPTTPSLSDDEVTLNTRFFRPNTITNLRRANFLLSKGGMGDFINYLSAIIWILKNTPQLILHIYTHKYFMSFVAFVLDDFNDKFEVKDIKDFQNRDRKFYPTYDCPVYPVNGTGAHLIDLGFQYFANLSPPPADGNYLPYPNYSPIDICQFNLPKKFAVLTPGASIHPGATTPLRSMPGSLLNTLSDHLNSIGVTPVYLGVTRVGEGRPILYGKDYDFSKGLNLINQTSIVEAAAIMYNAEMVIGIDNGLLHLAATTDTPIIFGYTVASPQHRQPRRAKGLTINVYPDVRELGCTFCQSQIRFLYTWDSARNCLYNDLKCLEIMARPKVWIESINKILGITK